jgi:hypothetical protein
MSADLTESKNVINPETLELESGVIGFTQAHAIYKNFVQDNKERNRKNAAIARKINNEQPWNPRKLKAAGQSWRSNRPTGFMSAMLKRIAPPYKQMVDQLPLLTFSRFPGAQDKEAKQDIFRKKITDTIRSWSGWSDYQQQLIDENVGYGYAAVTWNDDYSWKPELCRQDEALFYVGCPQLAKECKTWARKKDYYVDEIAEILKRPEAAEAAGWRVKALVAKLNSASKQFDDKSTDENARVYEDLIRENNLASSFTSTIRVVKTGHLFVQNPQGGVDHYIFDRDDGKGLFFRRGRYAKMEHILALFSAEVGDRTLHGSRGAGRTLYNTHVSVEQSRNLINDALHLSGLLLLKRTTKAGSGATETPGLSVNHPFAVLGDGYDVVENVKFEVNSEAFFALDRHSTSQAEIQVGAFMPGQIVNEAGERRTASEVNYVASIDAQIRAGVLARYADQTFNSIDEIQRRICLPENVAAAEAIVQEYRALSNSAEIIYDAELYQALTQAGYAEQFFLASIPEELDADAVKCVTEMLLEGLTGPEILVLANTSSRANVDDAIASQSGILDMVVASYAADPLVDAVELKRRHLSSKLGAGAAERLLNVDLNPLSPLKQQRTQLMELTSMLNDFASMPVDPTDDDVVHLAVIVSRVLPMLENLQVNPLLTSQQFFIAVAEHTTAHVQSATQKGVPPDQLADAQALLAQLEQIIPLPPVDQQAYQATASALQPGVVPATEVAQDAPPMPSLVPAPQQSIQSVADPVRPTPPRGVVSS